MLKRKENVTMSRLQKHALPASALRLPGFAVGRSNLEVLIDYEISDEGTVNLTDTQEKLRERLIYVDSLMRENRHTPKEIANLHNKMFGLSMRVAYRDIADAGQVYGKVIRPNKQYLVVHLLDRLMQAIAIAERNGDAKLAGYYYEIYDNALRHLPDDEEQTHKIPSTIIFNATTNEISNITEVQLSPAEANEIAAKRLSAWGLAIEDIFHEEI